MYIQHQEYTDMQYDHHNLSKQYPNKTPWKNELAVC